MVRLKFGTVGSDSRTLIVVRSGGIYFCPALTRMSPDE